MQREPEGRQPFMSGASKSVGKPCFGPTRLCHDAVSPHPYGMSRWVRGWGRPALLHAADYRASLQLHRLALGARAAGFAGVVTWQVRAVLRSQYPPLRAIEALAAAAFLVDLRSAPSTTAIRACPGCHAGWVPDDAVKPTDRAGPTWVEALAALDVEALAAEAGMFREQLPLAEGIAAKLSRLLLGFLQVEVLPQMPRPGS